MSERTDLTGNGSIKLKINDVATYMTKIGQRSEGPREQVAGIEWHIRAYPQVVDNVTYLSCYLVGENAGKWSAWVDATFRIVKENGGGFGGEASSSWAENRTQPEGGRISFRRSADSGFVANDSVEIHADVSVTDICGGAASNVFETAEAFAADVKLKVGDSVFYANKGHLSVMSSVFRDAFALTEAAAEDKKETEELELKDLDAGEFKEFLGAIYPTQYPITDTNVISMFRIADRYDVKHLVADCERYLYGANGVPWFDKLKLALDLNRVHLKGHLISMMTCDDLKAISENEDLDKLGVDVLQALFRKHAGMHHI